MVDRVISMFNHTYMNETLTTQEDSNFSHNED